MKKLTDFTSYADAQAHFAAPGCGSCSTATASGSTSRTNASTATPTGGADRGAIVAHADGRDEVLSFGGSRLVVALRPLAGGRGVAPGDRVAIMLEPSLRLLRRAVRRDEARRDRGAAVHAVRPRRRAPARRGLHADACSSPTPRRRRSRAASTASSVVVDDAPAAALDGFPARSRRRPRPTISRSSSTPPAPRASCPRRCKHTHRAIVTLMVAALYGTGIRPGDRFFCPSSPAWGHGLWHGTLAPLALGRDHRRLCRQVRRGAAAAALEEHASPTSRPPPPTTA